ncbi:hypothetical protein EJ03DRAFT_174610 [Teratosphaeria nubilosa]|uniref:Protein kinase domain-containing protein n=1 Tax=Teratosphaeria nubilosa TaxID=161662 RepID=A0A6G1L120_9PEZI|nr:hypothetical protein EJ03DRAFT_174610 [Teratosphaeria nubilosa]
MRIFGAPVKGLEERTNQAIKHEPSSLTTKQNPWLPGLPGARGPTRSNARCGHDGLDRDHKTDWMTRFGKGTKSLRPRYFLPRRFEDPSSAWTDLFALGSVLHAILRGKELYDGRSEEEISQLLIRREIPGHCTLALWSRAS